MAAQNNLPDKVLFIDDDPSIAQGVKDGLSRYQISVVDGKDLESSLYIFNQQRFEVVCVELDFEPMPGLVMVQKLRSVTLGDKRHCGIILMLGNKMDSNPGDQRLLHELRDIETIHKPFTTIQLLPILSRAKLARDQSLKYEEMKQTALKLGQNEDKLDKAVAMIEKQIPQLGVRGLEMLLELYEKHEKWDHALEITKQLIAKDSLHAGYANAKGRILLRMGQHEEALKFIEKADQAAPNQIERLNDLASLYLTMNQPDDAVNSMKKLIKFHPEEPNMKFDMFSKLYDYGFDEHAQGLCKSTTSPIEVVRYYNNKGVALKNSGNIEGALLEYERSLKFYPKFKENYRILYNIALAYVSMKTKESYLSAKEYLEQCLALKADFEKAQTILAQVDQALSGKKKKGA